MQSCISISQYSQPKARKFSFVLGIDRLQTVKNIFSDPIDGEKI